MTTILSFLKTSNHLDNLDIDFSYFVDYTLLFNELFSLEEIELEISKYNNIKFKSDLDAFYQYTIHGVSKAAAKKSIKNGYQRYNKFLINLLNNKIKELCDIIELNNSISIYNFMFTQIKQSIINESNIEKKYIYLTNIKLLFEQNRSLLKKVLIDLLNENESYIYSLKICYGMYQLITSENSDNFDFNNIENKFISNLENEINVLQNYLALNIRVDITNELTSLSKPKGIIPIWKVEDSLFVELLYLLQEIESLEVKVSDTDNRYKGIELIYKTFFEIFNKKYSRPYSSIIDNIKKRQLVEIDIKYAGRIVKFKTRYTGILKFLEKSSE